MQDDTIKPQLKQYYKDCDGWALHLLFCIQTKQSSSARFVYPVSGQREFLKKL